MTKFFKLLLNIIAEGAIGVTLSIGAIVILAQFGFSYLPVLMVGGFLVLFVAVVVHEMGHLVAALAFDFQVTQFVARPLNIVREGGQFRLRFVQPFGWPQGWVRGFPINDRKLRARFALFVLGGPLASLAAGLACLLVKTPGVSARPTIWGA